MSLWPVAVQSGNCGSRDSSIHGISQLRILQWVAISFSRKTWRILEWVTISFFRGSSWPRHWILVSCLTGKSLTLSHQGSPIILCSVQFSHSVMSHSLRPHESQHARPPCPSPTPGVHSNSCPSSQWCHPAISSSVVPFSSCPQSLPASGSFPMSQIFTWGGQSIGVSASASVLPMNTFS